MIQAHISRDSGGAQITATGGVNEILNDVAVLISGLHTQLAANDPVAAQLFQTGLTGLILDSRSPLLDTHGRSDRRRLQKAVRRYHHGSL